MSTPLFKQLLKLPYNIYEASAKTDDYIPPQGRSGWGKQNVHLEAKYTEIPDSFEPFQKAVTFLDEEEIKEFGDTHI